MPYSSVTYSGDGSTRAFTIPFDYINTTDVTVTVDGDTVEATISGALASCDTAPANAAVVVVIRATENEEPVVDFVDGATQTEADLDRAFKQLLFVIQETLDSIATIPGAAAASTNVIFSVAGSRPAAGTANRIHIATDTKQISFDNGATWANCSPAHTGDVTSSAGANALTIGALEIATTMLQASCVTYAKIQNVSATDKILGRSTAGAGVVEEVPCTATGRSLIAASDAAAARTLLGVGADAAQSISVNRNGVAQNSIVTATDTKVEHTTEAFDASGVYDNSVNYRLTPTIAGKYLVSASIKLTNLTVNKYVKSMIFKNGALLFSARSYSGDSAEDVIVQAVALVEMNGTTDYLEHYVYHNNGSNRNLDGITNATFFQAIRVSA